MAGVLVDPATLPQQLVLSIRRFNAALAAEPRVTATVIQTAGSKGYDGLALVTDAAQV